MSTLDVQPAPAAAPISAVPIAQQVESLSPEQAKTRLSELTHDKEWGARFMVAKPGSAENNLFDALTRRAADVPAAMPSQPQTAAEKVRAGLEPPVEGPEAYKVEDLQGREIKMDDDSQKLVHEKLLPAGHRLGLSQTDVTSIVSAMQHAEAVKRPMTREQCQATLEKLWGRDGRYEQG